MICSLVGFHRLVMTLDLFKKLMAGSIGSHYVRCAMREKQRHHNRQVSISWLIEQILSLIQYRSRYMKAMTKAINITQQAGGKGYTCLQRYFLMAYRIVQESVNFCRYSTNIIDIQTIVNRQSGKNMTADPTEEEFYRIYRCPRVKGGCYPAILVDHCC